MASNMPTNAEIYDLHKKYAPSDVAFNLVYGHCQIVWSIARDLIERNHVKVDREVVRAGCLLHDIGVYTLFNGDVLDGKNYITHGIRGEELLRQEGYDERLIRIASHHTGVGLSADDIVQEKLPLPQKDYLAETPEERLVMYADKFHSKTQPPQFNSVAWYGDHVAQFGENKRRQFMAMVHEFGEPDLGVLAKQYGGIIR